MIGSAWFGHKYTHHQELTTIVLITTRAVRFLSCCWLEVSCRQAIACSPDTSLACQHPISNQEQPKNETTNVVLNIIVVSP